MCSQLYPYRRGSHADCSQLSSSYVEDQSLENKRSASFSMLTNSVNVQAFRQNIKNCIGSHMFSKPTLDFAVTGQKSPPVPFTKKFPPRLRFPKCICCQGRKHFIKPQLVKVDYNKFFRGRRKVVKVHRSRRVFKFVECHQPFCAPARYRLE